MRFLLVAVVSALIGCQLPEPQPVPYPYPLDGGELAPFNVDAEPVPETPERAQCSRMCDHMQTLGCPIGKPTPQRKEPCVSWCTRIQSKHEIDLHPDCIASVASCDRVGDCER